MSAREPTLDVLAAKQAITDVLHQYCRGVDRLDSELARSCWHPGGIDEHSAIYSGAGEGWIAWCDRVHQEMSVTRHTISNILIEVEGEDAWSECYWTLYLRVPRGDGEVDYVGGGRYLDYFQRLDGAWAIRRRRSVRDWDRVDPVIGRVANYQGSPIFPHDADAPHFVPTRNPDDPSYDFLIGHRREF